MKRGAVRTIRAAPVFSCGLFVFGSGSRPKSLQNDDIQSVFLFLRRTGNKKGASEKGSFVRIKGLEPPRRKASDPKSDVATNYTISARYVQRYIKIHKSQSGAGIIRLFYLLL